VTRFPLRYARGNVLIGPGGEAAALYRAETASYPFAPVAGKRALAHRLERFVQLVGADFSLWRVSRSYPAECYVQELAGLADPRHADPAAWRDYLESQGRRLAELDSHLPEVYLAVSLGESRRGGGVLGSFERARRRAEELAGISAPRPLSSAGLQAFAEAERRTFERLGSRRRPNPRPRPAARTTATSSRLRLVE
jgi:hypothetical protein